MLVSYKTRDLGSVYTTNLDNSKRKKMHNNRKHVEDPDSKSLEETSNSGLPGTGSRSCPP